MTGKELKYSIVTDASQGIKGLRDFSTAAKRAMQDVEDSTDDTTTSAQKLAKAYSKVADELEADLHGAAAAAKSLGDALGPELAAQADLGRIVTELRQMGLSFEEISADADVLAASLKDLDRVQKIKIQADDQASDDLRDAKRAADDLDGEQVDIKVRGEGLDELTDKLGELPGMLGTVSQAVGSAGLAGAAGAAGAAFVGAANAAADMALEAKVTADLTGATVEQASALQAVWSGSGADVNDLNDVLLQMNGVLQTTPGLAAQIGVNLDDGRSIVERFLQVVKLLDASMLPAAQKAQLMSQLFGEEGVRQVQRLVSTFGDLETAMAAVAPERIVHDEDVAAALEMKKQFAEMTTLLQGLVADLGQQLVPVLGEVVGLLGQANSLQTDIKRVPVIGDIFKNFMPGLGQLQTRLDQAHWVWDHTFGRHSDIKASIDLEDSVKGAVDTVADFNGELTKILDKRDPLRRFQDQWQTIFDDLADGRIDTEEAGRAVQFLADQLGIQPSDVLTIAVTKLGDAAKKSSDAVLQSADDLEEWAKRTEDAILAAGDMQQQLDDMAGAFPTMARGLDAMRAAFDLKDAPLNLQGEVRDINLAINDLSENLKGIKVGDVLAGSVKADKFLDAIDSLRGPIQTKITEAFGTGGPEAAIKLANSYIDQVTKELGGKFTREQVAKMLGLDDITATVKVAVDLKSLAEAKAILELFAKLPETDPALVMQLQMDLAAGNITPAGILAVLDPILRNVDVNIPTQMLPPDPQSKANAKTDADNFYRRNPALMSVQSGPATGLGKTLTDAQRILNAHPLTATVIAKAAGFLHLDAGGTAGAGGGLVAERRPEIVNSRYLVTSPTVVPPGTRVTSGARTARILRTRGSRGLRRYDSGGVVSGTVNVNINAGVVGNRYDVMRTVRKATNDGYRLMGTRG